MKRLLPPLLLLLVSSCISLDKAIRVATKSESHAEATQQALNSKHALVVAENCATLFPIKETIITKRDTVRKEVTIPGDSIPCPEVTDAKTGKVYTPKVKCPDVSYYSEQITELTEKTQESTAGQEAERLKRERAEQELLQEKKAHLATMEEREKAQKQRNTLLWIVGGAVVAVVLAGLRKLKIV